jgi:hypothetical protein
MHTKWSSVVIAVVLAGCASKAPQSSKAAPSQTVAQATATIPPPPVVTAQPLASATVKPKVEVEHAKKLAVKRISIARGVNGHEPVDAATTFDAKNEKVYAFVEVENPEKLPGEITVEFMPPSKKYEGRVTLGVGESSRWRTWAFTRQAHEAGEWTAIVRDERGHELAREKFDITS